MVVRRPVVALFASVALLVTGCAGLDPLPDGAIETVRVESLDLPGQLWEPFMPPLEQGAPVTVEGKLSIPPTDQPVPAVILIHGCGGPRGAERGWVDDLNDLGYGVLLIDSFTPRSVDTVCFGGGRVNLASLLVDAYRSADVLAEHPYIDGSKLAIIGFSYGGRTALWTAMARFQDLYEGSPFQAHVAFYPSTCFIELEGEADVSETPIRILHGEADDWTPIDQCKDYVARLAGSGADIELISYVDAHHGFDDETTAQGISPLPAVSPRNCRFVEVDGAIVDPDTGGLAGVDSTCVEVGVHFGWNKDAHAAAKRDLAEILAEAFSNG